MALAQVVENPPKHWPGNTVILKAGDITEPGYYWYFACGEWEVSRVVRNDSDTALIFLFAGTEIEQSTRHVAGDFIGPIAPPA